jgi:hypothetical protein
VNGEERFLCPQDSALQAEVCSRRRPSSGAGACLNRESGAMVALALCSTPGRRACTNVGEPREAREGDRGFDGGKPEDGGGSYDLRRVASPSDSLRWSWRRAGVCRRLWMRRGRCVSSSDQSDTRARCCLGPR